MQHPPSSRFAYSPEPVEGELLSSWLQRTAIEHKASPQDFVPGAGPDVDWDPNPAYLARLSMGSALAVDRFRSMTLRASFPEARRDWFAWSTRPFPGCHAFCPRCGEGDMRSYGAVIQRVENAGVWKLACGEHACLLDGVRERRNVEPWKRGEPGGWARGKIAPTSSSRAPSFALAFQETAEAALRGFPPSARWLVREPEVFLALASQLADLILRTIQFGFSRTSGLDLLVGHVWSEAPNYGAEFVAPKCLDRLPATERTRTLVGVALLMMCPIEWPTSAFDEWFGWGKGYRDANRSWRPWVRVTEAWGLQEIGEAAALITRGPDRFRLEAEAGLAPRIAYLRDRGWR